ncbi:MAG: hypothetical protein WBC91_24665 [Phototrophicaceae bacterium]
MMTISQQQIEWLTQLPDSILAYLASLQVDNKVGRYLPAQSDLTPLGEKVALGQSCYALKIYYMLGQWQQLSADTQHEWIQFIQLFQTGQKNAFIDPIVYQYLSSYPRRGTSYKIKQYLKSLFGLAEFTHLDRTIHAETKQAIATLIEAGASPQKIFSDFPMNSAHLKRHLETLNWENPWAAGANTTTIAVFLDALKTNQNYSPLVQTLTQQLADFIVQTVDNETGTYYIAPQRPHYDNLINGAMKVLTTLDWLDVPIHRPRELIDTCLSQMPSSEGCHIVDAVYVLYRCSQQVDYRRADCQSYCIQLLDMIQTHYVADEGAFSYFSGKSQVSYYGVPITNGKPIADMHGTILITWALAMIFDLLDDDRLPQWHIIKP